MLQLTTIINNKLRYVDLFDDEDIQLDYSFAEIQDITSKNSSFSKSFSIPGSKNNNDIFQHYYDLNSSLTDYDIRTIFEASLLNDGYEIMKGFIRLESVSVDVKNVVYKVVFYSEVGRLTSNIGDKVLAQVSFTELDHPYDIEVITDSIYDPDFVDTDTYTEPYEDGRITYMLANYGYDYNDANNIITSSTPILDYRDGLTSGYFDYIGTPLRFYYLKPAVQIKWLYEKIFSEAGFNIVSDFFDTAYFKRYYLPLTFTDDSLYLRQAAKPRLTWNIDSRSGGTITTQSITWTNLNAGPSGLLERGIQTPTIEDNINAHTYSNFSFKPAQDGNYIIRISYGGFNDELIPDTIDLSAEAQFFLHQIELGGHNGLTGTTLFSSVPINIQPGSSFLDTRTFSVFLSENFDYSIDFRTTEGIGTAQINFFNFEILDGPRTIIGDVNLALELPEAEQKQIDFISGINKKFNLVVVPDINNPQTFVIEPVVDYIGKGDTLDWSRKLDYNSPINISPTTSVINGTLYYSAEKDEDFGNTEFTKSTNVLYGARYVQLSTDYKSQQTEFNDGFSNAVDDIVNNISQPNITIPIFYITREENKEGDVVFFYNARKTLPRVMFRGMNLPAKNVGFNVSPTATTINTFYLEQTEVDMFPIYNRFTTYPFGVSGLTHAVNYNKTHRFTNVEYDFRDTEDLYDVYYKEYIDDLINSDNKILVANFYLLPEEIASLKGSEKIFINNNYYRINKINNYNLTNRDIVEVELIKLTGDYEAHRKKCYILRACDDPADIIYTNTDLNWTLYAYVGKKVKLNGFCYEIEEAVCDDTKTYERITLPFIEGSFQPETYNDCGCYTLSDSVNIYNDFSGTTINPTPTPTPTAPQQQYYYYTMSKCDEQILFLGRSTNFYSGGTIVRTNASSNVCWIIDGLVNIPNTNDITTTYINCDTCAADVPTPTPTPTKTPTPTPTFVCTCKTYQVNNDNSINLYIDYKDCYGVNQTRNVSPGQFFYVCACNGTMTGTADFTIVGDCVPTTPTPTPTTTKTPTPTPTTSLAPAPPPESPTPTPSITASPTPTNTLTPTPTNTLTPTPTSSLTPTPTITATNTQTPTPSISPTQTATPTITPTITRTPTNTPTNTTTLTPTPTPSATPPPQPPLLANMALWYDATDASTITTADFSGITRVISFVSKGYSALTLSNNYLTNPISAPRYIPSSNFVGKNTIRFSGETIATNDRQRLVSPTGTTANISLPNGSTFILFSKNKFSSSNYQAVVVDARQQRSQTAGAINTFLANPIGQVIYGSGTNGIGNTLFTIGSGGISGYEAQQSVSAYTNFQLFITKLDNPTTRLPYSWINKTQLEKSASQFGLLETSGSTINYIAMGGRISQFGTFFTGTDGVGSEFYEYIVYDKVLTDAELDDVYNYFDAKYGYNSLFDSANYNTYDVKLENYSPYGATTATSFNNFFSINGSPIGQTLQYLTNYDSTQNPLYYVRSIDTFNGVNKAYINKNLPVGFTERSANGIFGAQSQSASYADPGVRVITYANDGSTLQVSSGCNWTNSSIVLLPNVDYQITGSTENVCGYTSATTWNTFIEYNSSSPSTSFYIQNSFSGFNQTTFFVGTGFSATTLVSSGQVDNFLTTISNSTTNTAYTETFEIWICDSVGTDIQLLGSYTGYDTYAYNVFNTTSPDLPTISTPSKTSQLYWKQQNHFKVKYTAV